MHFVGCRAVGRLVIAGHRQFVCRQGRRGRVRHKGGVHALAGAIDSGGHNRHPCDRAGQGDTRHTIVTGGHAL
ncbi:hypothetical protein, partial [Aeromonas jandaei]|uniref:hypothetical protein n=1 Tax=Aeromonas jandaei TaxID=650 RepID=UPI003D23BAFC